MGSDAAVAASRSDAGACGLRGSSCSVRERCRSFLWVQKQQLQRPGALPELSVGSEAAVAASRSVTGALQRPGNSSCSVQERSRSAAVAQDAAGGRIGDVARAASTCEALGDHGANYIRDVNIYVYILHTCLYNSYILYIFIHVTYIYIYKLVF